MAQGPAISVWLQPDDQRVQQTIDRLSAQHAAPRFEAHLTLLGGVDAALAEQAERALAALAADASPLELPVVGSGESDVYFETAFLRCAETAELRALRERVRALLGSGRAPAIGPHVSLIYARLPRETRRAITRAPLIAQALRFDAIALVGSGPQGWEPVESWRMLARQRLGG